MGYPFTVKAAPAAALGNFVTISDQANPLTGTGTYTQPFPVAQGLADENPACGGEKGAGGAWTIYLQVLSPPADSHGTANANVVFSVEWGYGSQIQRRFISTQNRRIVVNGSFVRVSAFLVATGDTFAGLSAIVSAATVPGNDGETLWESTWNGLAVTPTVFPPTNPQTGISSTTHTGSYQYLLSNLPGTLLRLHGFRYDTGSSFDYIGLYDANALASIGNPIMQSGAIASNGTFSLDVATTGRDFSQGLCIQACSDGAMLSADASALLSVDCEIFNN